MISRKALFLFTIIVTSALITHALLTNATEPPRVVLIHGWHGSGDTFKVMIPILEQQGITVIDFDDTKPGTQALTYAPTGSGQGIAVLADQVEEMIKARTSPGEHINIVAHSMGGLISRYLIEQGPYDPNIDDNWAERVDTLIMLGTPNHGTWEAYVGSLSPLFGDWAAAANDMEPGSAFLDTLGYSEPAGERYITVGGNPWYLPNFDGVVPTDSPHLTGSEQYNIAGHHGELVTLPNAVDLVLNVLGYTPADLGESLPLVGTGFIRIEYFHMSGDHEWGTEEYFMDVYVDTDGGADTWQSVGTIEYDRDGPFTWAPGNSGPNTGTFVVPGTSPRIDVKVVLREDSDTINVFYYYDILLSEDVDGVDYYADTAPDSGGGTNEIRISVNGITSNIDKTVDVKVVLDKVRVDDDGDSWGQGENYFKTWAGELGHELHYEKWAIFNGEDTYWIYSTYSQGSGYDAIIYQGRMVKTDTLRVRLELWDEDTFSDDHLSGDLDWTWTAMYANGYYYSDQGAAVWYFSITVT